MILEYCRPLFNLPQKECVSPASFDFVADGMRDARFGLAAQSTQAAAKKKEKASADNVQPAPIPIPAMTKPAAACPRMVADFPIKKIFYIF
ncbi:hypothetical protein [Caenibacillus caldisaponilyticus]|uniref:hypothetical protein n=1 Tax=Caenibacillus caldisaponilyticus TaxID=1674942 RepID=UPI0009888C5F|nr:hypothetical protein [Caenibacillus caldisaponilyticus]